MRALNVADLGDVAGGAPTIAEGLGISAAIGSGVGSSAVLELGGGLTGIAVTSGASTAVTIGSGAALGLAGAAYAGWEIGTAISNHLPESVNDAIGAGIARAIDTIGGWFQSGDTAGGGAGRSPFMCYMDAE